jgi:hypothetical protein
MVGMIASVTLATGARAIVPDSSGQNYNGIAERNLFGLRPPPPPPAPVTPAPPPLPKVILTGLTTILGNEIAFLKVQFPAKPGEPAKEQSFMLKEGEREGEIEVVDINIPAETVRVRNSGTLMPITFDKSPPTPAPAPTPAATAAQSNVTSNPAMAAPSVPNVRTNPFSIRDLVNRRPIPTRTIRLPGSNIPAQNSSGQSAPAVVPNATYQPQAAAPQGALTPEEQVLQELERQSAQGTQNPAPQ